MKDNDEPINEQQLQGLALVQSVDDDGEKAVEGQQGAQQGPDCHLTWPGCTGLCFGGRVCQSLRSIRPMCFC